MSSQRYISQLEHNVILSCVFKCIKRASEHRGKVFGGFVRDVIVPRLSGSSSPVSFKDVDLWFTCQSDADSFVSAMGPLFCKFDICVSEGSYPGAFNRNQYHLIKYASCLAWIDVIVSTTLPVNDFDVNKVTYYLDSDNNWVTSSNSRLIQQIRNKHAVMLPIYHSMIDNALCSNNSRSSSYKQNPHYKVYHHERIDRIFISKGWEVSVPTTIKTVSL